MVWCRNLLGDMRPAVKNDFRGYDELISLLVLWHRLENMPHVAWYPHECPYLNPVSSRQHDFGPNSNGAGDTDERGRMAMRIGKAVDGMDEPFRTAIKMLARNRATGIQVWISPRLPQDKDARAELVSEAMSMLAEMV